MLFAATISFLLILAVSAVSRSGVFGMKHFEFNSAALAVENEEPTNSLLSLSSSEGIGMGLARSFFVFLFTPPRNP